ncbi:MAG: VOC family protein [Caulobacteraceae bacterium]
MKADKEQGMSKTFNAGLPFAFLTASLLCAAVGARAQQTSAPQSLPPVRVGAASINAVDVETTATFYKKAFGFREIRRIDVPKEPLEIIMNLGADVNAARANPGAALIVIARSATTAPERYPAIGWARVHLVLVVDDMASALARVRENGGSVPVEPSTNRGSLQSEVNAKPDSKGTHMVAMAQDPGGNAVELLSPK